LRSRFPIELKDEVEASAAEKFEHHRLRGHDPQLSAILSHRAPEAHQETDQHPGELRDL
jgi:hypothetical protein